MIRVLLAEDVRILREALADLLDREDDVEVVAQVAAGIAGFMVKDSAPGELVDAVRTVAAGGRVVDPQLAFAALDAPDCPLTDRECEVLRLTASGAEPPQIAARIGLSYGTVRNYLASAVTKLGARNRVDAIRIAAEAGWI